MKRLTSNIEGLSARQLAQRCIGAEELSNGRERKLALGDDILMSVSSPARYVGGEVNSVMKTLTPGMVRFAMCFPDVYEIGMSHLGIQILYDMFNRYDDVWCERVYSPWLDLDKIMREKKIPLFALESQEPVKNFDFLGITLQYEMCYTNVLQVLDLSGIPLLAKDRTEEDPIVIGGGPCSYNPEPIAEFFDLFYIGEGETAYRKLLDVYKEVKEKGGSRQEFLLRAAREVPGMYVPSLYEVSYKEDGTIASFVPTKEGVPAKITKEMRRIRRNRWFRLSVRHRIVSFWKFSAAVSAAVVSVRQGSCIVRYAKRASRPSSITRRRCWTAPVRKKFP